MPTETPYFPGLPPSKPEPLGRYLPPLPEGVATNWLSTFFPHSPATGDRQTGGTHAWVLDPFGTSPRLTAEIARAGYQVLVAANNPVNRFLIEIQADPPSERELRSVLAELATSRRGSERLEPHIRSLYLTQCDQCKNEIHAEAFLWERGTSNSKGDSPHGGGPSLFGRIYHCPYCGKHGEHPSNDADIERAAQFSRSSLHRARALERVVSFDDPDRHHVEEALSVYLPRAVYALFTLINNLDGLDLSPTRKKHLTALLLTTLDLSNTLWPHPARHTRPRQLKSRPRFRENNIWLALESSISRWASSTPGVPLVVWPTLPPQDGGICLFEGRLKDLTSSLGDIQISTVLTAIPRPNQAFWTLSALWSGWLWGRDSVGPFKSVLRRRRYDWGWHSSALQAALVNLYAALKSGTPMLGLIGETEPAFLSAVLIAAEAANFDLQGLALLAESDQTQITWQRSARERISSPVTIETQSLSARQAVQTYLQERGEPASYIQVHGVTLSALASSHHLPITMKSPSESLSNVNTILEETFSYGSGFERIAGSDKSLEVGYWWLHDAPVNLVPLADRVEMELVRYLIKHPGSTLLEIASHIYTCFPGLLAPDSELIHVCLGSYGQQDPPESGLWKIRVTDLPTARRADLEQITSLLKMIAHNLGYQAEDQTPLIWRNPNGEVRYACYSIVSAVIGELLLNQQYPPEKSLLVLPGGRSNLVVYKLSHDPRLRQAVDDGWRFIKFRQVRWLAENPVMNEETLNEQLAKDPLRYDVPQMRLF